MAMKIESLEVLEQAEVQPSQARAIVRAIEIETAGAADSLVTKNEIALLRQEILGWRQELAASIATLPTRVEMTAMCIDLEGKMHALASAGIRQMIFAVLGQMGLMLGFAYFFATHVR